MRKKLNRLINEKLFNPNKKEKKIKRLKIDKKNALDVGLELYRLNAKSYVNLPVNKLNSLWPFLLMLFVARSFVWWPWLVVMPKYLK